MDRCWLLTSTTYGTWLPGDERGFVSNVRDGAGPEERHNIPGTPYDRDMPGLRQAARANLKGEPIFLDLEKAKALLSQFQETARYRDWQLLAVAIMHNHVHIVVGVPDDPDPEDLLRDFKSYGSRVLNRRWGKPASETWWTESGSKRKLPEDDAIQRAIEYVRNQSNPLLIWIAEDVGERGA